jgi:hypothetical protein
MIRRLAMSPPASLWRSHPQTDQHSGSGLPDGPPREIPVKSGLKLFLSVLTRTKIGLLGAVLTTTGFIAQAMLLGWEASSGHSNPYAGIVVWNVVPGLIALGLALIPFGIWRRARKIGGGRFSMKTLREMAGEPDAGALRRSGLIVGGLTAINALFFVTVGYSGYHYMDSSEFCGMVCHQVMEPEYVAYQRSAHSGVECVKCHIGPGAGWFVKSKLSGAWQVIAVVGDLYPRPIETPVKALRPAPETCHQCHNPAVFKGNRIKTIKRYDTDRDNTLLYTILNMRVGGGEEIGHPSQGIHWHITGGMELTYQAADEQWDEVVSIQVDYPDGTSKSWARRDDEGGDVHVEVERVMDCVDCHNRTAHHMLGAEEALDERLRVGAIDTGIPWIKREALAVFAVDYDSPEAAFAAFATVEDRYREDMPQVWAEHEAGISSAVGVLEETWSTFVYPRMNIEWGTYPSRRTHSGDRGGCFRCHNDGMVTEQGEQVSSECEICHYVLAESDPTPDAFRCLHVEHTVQLF